MPDFEAAPSEGWFLHARDFMNCHFIASWVWGEDEGVACGVDTETGAQASF